MAYFYVNICLATVTPIPSDQSKKENFSVFLFCIDYRGEITLNNQELQRRTTRLCYFLLCYKIHRIILLVCFIWSTKVSFVWLEMDRKILILSVKFHAHISHVTEMKLYSYVAERHNIQSCDFHHCTIKKTLLNCTSPKLNRM